jgi:hypothetical protein
MPGDHNYKSEHILYLPIALLDTYANLADSQNIFPSGYDFTKMLKGSRLNG